MWTFSNFAVKCQELFGVGGYFLSQRVKIKLTVAKAATEVIKPF